MDMDHQLWTPEAIKHTEILEGLYIIGSIMLVVSLVMPCLCSGPCSCYKRTHNGTVLFIMPSLPMICIVAGAILGEYMFHNSISFDILGVQIGINPVMPSTCAAATEILGPENGVCSFEDFREWALLFVHGGSWSEICTTRALKSLGFCSLLELPWAFCGCVLAYLNWERPYCRSCEQGVDPAEMEGSDPRNEHPQCRRCRDVELGTSRLDAGLKQRLLV